VKPSLERTTRNLRGSFVWAIGSLFLLAGALTGAKQLSDNSFFTHLATGHIIWDTRSIPRADPFTFTAFGEPWVVQSWLVSTIYAGLESTVGLVGIRFFHAFLAGLGGLGIWHLTKSAESLIPRLAIAALGFAVCAPGFVERPLMVGFVAFVAILILVDNGPLWTAIPLMWIWINSHGSFPMGILILLAITMGKWLDGDDIARQKKLLSLVAIGIVIGGFITPRPGVLLWFPFQLLARNQAFQAIQEWQSPDFSTSWMKIYLFQLVLVMVALTYAWVQRWSKVLPVCLMVAAALLAVRNVPMAGLFFSIALADAAPSFGSFTASQKLRSTVPLLGAAALSLISIAVWVIKSPDLNLKQYPMSIIIYLEKHELLPNPEVRLAYPARLGNYLNYRYGATGTTFFDDRFDVYPLPILDSFTGLYRGSDVRRTLDQYQIDYVVAERETPIAHALGGNTDWQQVIDLTDSGRIATGPVSRASDAHFVLFERR